MKLSILVPTVPSRIETFYPKIMNELNRQVGENPEIEILAFYDNKRRSVGSKRNALIELSRGEFICFVDDDDEVAEDYIEKIVQMIDRHPDSDVVVFDVLCTIDGAQKQYCRYGIELEYTTDHNNWYGKPAHTHVWRREIARMAHFSERPCGEDIDWVSEAWPRVKIQHKIEKVLYYYNFNEKTTETRPKKLNT